MKRIIRDIDCGSVKWREKTENLIFLISFFFAGGLLFLFFSRKQTFSEKMAIIVVGLEVMLATSLIKIFFQIDSRSIHFNLVFWFFSTFVLCYIFSMLAGFLWRVEKGKALWVFNFFFLMVGFGLGLWDQNWVVVISFALFLFFYFLRFVSVLKEYKRN